MQRDDPTANSPADLGFALRAPERKVVTFEIPSGTAQKSCRSCGAPMFWVKTRTGRSMPVNADGTSHFASCPEAGSWRKT